MTVGIVSTWSSTSVFRASSSVCNGVAHFFNSAPTCAASSVRGQRPYCVSPLNSTGTVRPSPFPSVPAWPSAHAGIIPPQLRRILRGGTANLFGVVVPSETESNTNTVEGNRMREFNAASPRDKASMDRPPDPGKASIQEFTSCTRL